MLTSLSAVLTKFTDYAVKADKDCGEVVMYRGLPSREGRYRRSVMSVRPLKGRGISVDRLAEKIYSRNVDIHNRPRASLDTITKYLTQDLKYTYEAVMWLRLEKGSMQSYPKSKRDSKKVTGKELYFQEWGEVMKLAKWEQLFDFKEVYDALMLRYPESETGKFNKIIHVSGILHLFFEFEQEGVAKGYDDYISSVFKQRADDDAFEPAQMTAAQKSNYVSWKTIQKASVAVFKGKHKKKFSPKEIALLALYTLLPPRRGSLGLLVLAVGDEGWERVQANIRLANTILPKRGSRSRLSNWLWVSSKTASSPTVRIVLTNYKTAPTFGPFVYELGLGVYRMYRTLGSTFDAVEPVPDQHRIRGKKKFFIGQAQRDKMVRDQLMKYIRGKRRRGGVADGARLFPAASFGRFFKNTFKKLVDKTQIDTRMLRHIYITHALQKNLAPLPDDREVLGRLLGHNARQLEKYGFSLEQMKWIAPRSKK